MSKINISLFILSYLVITSCSSQPTDLTKPLDESIKIERIRDPWGIKASFDNGRYYLLKDLKSRIQVYERDSLIGDIENTKTIINGNSLMVTGPSTKSMIDVGNEILIFQSYSNQIKVYNKADLTSNPELIKLQIKNTVNIIDGFYIDNKNIGFSTYNPDRNINNLSLNAFNKKDQKITKIYEETLNHPADHSLVRNINGNLYILNPFDKTLLELNKKYQLTKSHNLDHFEGLNLTYTKAPQYNSPDEYFRMSVEEQLSSFNDEIYDFYINHNSLYILVRKRLINSDHKIQSYSEILKLDLTENTFEKVNPKDILINFDQKGHILKYRQENKTYHLDILPLSKLFSK